MLHWLIACALGAGGAPALPHTVWLEAETFAPLKGANYSYLPESQETKGFMSIAARADEPGEIAVWRNADIPAGGKYTLWVRYADYRNREEAFGVRVTQGLKTFAHVFGRAAIVDELDPMKLYWGWAFAWDS